MQFTEEVAIKLIDEFTTTAKKIENSVGSLKSGFAVLGSAAVVGAVIAGIKKVGHEFAESEMRSVQLDGALRSMGITSKAVSKDYQEFAKEIQKTTMLTDEQAMSAERLFIQYGIVGDTMKKSIKVAAGLSAMYGIDLQDASLRLVKASEGNTTAFQKLGIKFDETKLKAEGYDHVLNRVSDTVKDFAGVALDTMSGRFNQLNKNMSEAMEKLGFSLDKIDRKFGISKGLSKTLGEFAQALEDSEDPLIKLRVKLKEVNDEMDELDKKKAAAGPMWNSFFGQSQKRMTELAEESKKLNIQIDALGVAEKKAAEEGKKQEAALEGQKKGFQLTGEEIKKLNDQMRKFYFELALSNADGFKKVNLERDKDLEQLESYYATGLKKDDRYYAAKKEIMKKWFNGMLAETSATMNSFSSTLEGVTEGTVAGMQKSFQGLGTFLGKVTGNKTFGFFGEVVSSAMGMASAIGAVFDAFEGDTRSRFERLTDQISELNTSINELEARIKNLKDDRSKKADKTKGTIQSGSSNEVAGDITGVAQSQGLGGRGGLKARGTADWVYKQIQAGRFGFEVSDEGDIIIYFNTVAVAAKIWSTSEWIIYKDLPGFGSIRLPDEEMRVIYEAILRSAMRRGQINLSALGTSSSERDKTISGSSSSGPRSFASSGSRSISRLRSSSNSGGGMASGNVINIQVNAMDEQGVNDFLTNKLAPAMRQLSGRQGVVFLNDKGVSTNI